MSVKNLSVTNDRNWIQSTYFDKGVGYCLKMCLFSEENKEFWYQWYLYTFIYFYLFFSYSCHTFFPITHPHLIHPDSHSQSSPLSGPMSPLLIFLCLLLPLLSPIISLPHTFLLLSDCSLFPSLWFYFAHLFDLLIRFHL